MGSTNVNAKTIEDAKSINAKIQGTRINKKNPTEETEPETNNISVSRQSYDSLYENFRSLVNLLEQDSKYNPIEADVNIVGLTAKKEEMLLANENVSSENYTLENNRILRDKRFYKDEDCLIEVARGVKKYIRGKYGINSPQFAQIKGLKFADYSPK